MGLPGLLGGGVGNRPGVSQACWGPAGGGDREERDHGSHRLGRGIGLWWLIPWLYRQG